MTFLIYVGGVFSLAQQSIRSYCVHVNNNNTADWRANPEASRDLSYLVMNEAGQ